MIDGTVGFDQSNFKFIMGHQSIKLARQVTEKDFWSGSNLQVQYHVDLQYHQTIHCCVLQLKLPVIIIQSGFLA